jgi:hypothetical protein
VLSVMDRFLYPLRSPTSRERLALVQFSRSTEATSAGDSRVAVSQN